MTRMSIKVLRGVNLVGKDRHLVAENTSDPYCKIYINGNQIARTPVQYQTTDPIWGGPMSTFEFEGDPNTTEILIKIYNFCEFKRDGRMGQVTFRAKEVLTKSERDRYPNVWLPIQSLEGCRCSGELEIHLLSLPPKAPNTSNNGARATAAVRASAIPTITEDQPAGGKDNELRESAIASLSAGPKLKAVGMGHNKASLKGRIMSSRCPVTLHVYDVSNDGRVAKFNAVAKPCPGLHGGIFHAAVEVYGREYSFGGSRNRTTGIFACRPRKCPMHHYRESLFLGDCDLTARQVDQILRKMKPEWMAPTYDLFRKNCCFFSKEFAIELGVGHIPEWVYSLANTGAAIDDYRIKREKARKEKELKAAEKEAERERQASAAIVAAEKQSASGRAARIKVSSVGSSIVGVESIEITTSFEGGGVEILSTDSRDEANSGGGGTTLPKIRETSEGCVGESVEVANFVNDIETGVLDNVMAARVQRAYRESVAVKKRRASMMPEAAAARQRL